MRLTKHRAALATALAAGVLLAAPALAQMAPPAVISVTGEATVSVPPDLAQIEGGVSSDAKTAREASEANNAAMAKPTIVGYHASNRVTIRLRDVTRIANVIDTLVGAGANDIGGVNFMVSQASKLLDQAREQAVADARRKAEIYAKAAGVTLSISEEGSPGPVPFRKMVGGMAASAPIAQGEETLAVTVSVSWAIKATGQ